MTSFCINHFLCLGGSEHHGAGPGPKGGGIFEEEAEENVEATVEVEAEVGIVAERGVKVVPGPRALMGAGSNSLGSWLSRTLEAASWGTFSPIVKDSRGCHGTLTQLMA
jgi:hypothetical protein